MGPLLLPRGTVFGERVSRRPAERFVLEVDVLAVHGLDTVELHGRQSRIGRPLEERSFGGSLRREALRFVLHPEQSDWVSLIVRDTTGRVAVSNPVWVHVAP